MTLCTSNGQSCINPCMSQTPVFPETTVRLGTPGGLAKATRKAGRARVVIPRAISLSIRLEAGSGLRHEPRPQGLVVLVVAGRGARQPVDEGRDLDVVVRPARVGQVAAQIIGAVLKRQRGGLQV